MPYILKLIYIDSRKQSTTTHESFEDIGALKARLVELGGPFVKPKGEDFTLPIYVYRKKNDDPAKNREALNLFIKAMNPPAAGEDDRECLLIFGPEETETEFNTALAASLPTRAIKNPSRLKPVFNRTGFFAHPGTWMFFALAVVGIGALLAVLVPWATLVVIAPILASLATLSTFAAVVLFAVQGYFYYGVKLDRYRAELIRDNISAETYSRFQLAFLKLMEWAFGTQGGQRNRTGHPVQAFFVVLGLGLSLAALVLTIGFFTGGGAIVAAGATFIATGGGAFAFMAPVFTAISTFFVATIATGVAAGTALPFTPLSLAICLGLLLTTVPLNLVANTFKRIVRIFSELSGRDTNPPSRSSDDEEILNDVVFREEVTVPSTGGGFNYSPLGEAGEDKKESSLRANKDLDEIVLEETPSLT